MQKKLIIVGNGMAAGRMVDELLARDAERFAITVIGDEIHGSYNRIMLSPVLSGEATARSIVQKPADWYASNNITFVGGVRVTQINRHAQTISCDNGSCLAYDELIIATGSRPARIPAKNQALAGVMAFRTLNDVDTILQLSQSAQNAVVIGGGLLGLEAAYGMAVRGIKVVLIHRSGWLLNRQLDKASGKMLEQVMATKGVEFRLGVEVETFIGTTIDTASGACAVTGAKLSNGEILPCQIAIIATGITPNAELGLDAGLEGNRGIKVDDYLTTSHPSISAIGECTEHNGQTFGLVEPIWQHCISLADRLCLNLKTAYQNTPVATKLKVSGVQVFSAGEWMTGEHHREFVYSDPARNIYRKLILEKNRIVGIVFFGDVRDGQFFFELMEHGVEIINAMPQLLMGRAFCAQLPEIQRQPDEVAA